jgi:hypothetical protein
VMDYEIKHSPIYQISPFGETQNKN